MLCSLAACSKQMKSTKDIEESWISNKNNLNSMLKIFENICFNEENLNSIPTFIFDDDQASMIKVPKDAFTKTKDFVKLTG